MVGVDTNIVIRILVQDDLKQAQLALNYIKDNCSITPAMINTIVICEVIWVLESAYNYSKKEIIVAIDYLLKTKQFLILEKTSVRSALKLYESSKIDFSDALIGHINSEQDCVVTITFDKVASKTDLYKLLSE